MKPYKPAVLDFKKKSDSKLLKTIEKITKSKSSKGKKEPNEDLTNYINTIIKESSNKKNSKQVDPDKVRILNYNILSVVKFQIWINNIRFALFDTYLILTGIRRH